MSARWIAGLLLVPALVGPLAAGETHIPVPAGARIGADMITIHDDRIAYGLMERSGDGTGVRTRVIQRIDGRQITTTFDGKARPERYSPDGELLLVSQLLETDPPCNATCPIRTVVLDLDGDIVWQDETHPRSIFVFSITGRVLYAGLRCAEGRCSGRVLDVFDRKGNPIGTIDPGRTFRNAVVLDDGTQALFVYTRSAELFDTDAEGPLWSVEFFSDGSAPDQVMLVGRDKLLARRGLGRFVVIGFDGQVVYDYDAERLGLRFLEKGVEYFKSFAARKGIGRDVVWLSSQSENMLLDLATGEFRPARIRPRVGDDPRYPALHDNKEVIVREDGVIVRDFWLDTR